MRNTTPPTYVTIHFDSHDYTATVTSFGQLSRFLSDKTEPFRLGSCAGHIPAWITRELNMITHLKGCRNRAATATK